MSDTIPGSNTIPPEPKAAPNFMWKLCNTTMKSQTSEGVLLASNSLLTEALTKMLDEINQAFVGDDNAPFSPEDDPNKFAGHDLEWYVKEMAYLAGKAGKKTDQKLGFAMTACQNDFSLQNTVMQSTSHTIDNASQEEKEQTDQDMTSLQSLITLASTGKGAADYAANLLQQTMG